MVEHLSVSSSNISLLGYDSDQRQLHVTFKNGSRYTYDGVPQDEYEALLSVGSIGRHFTDNIKDSYPYRRV